MRRIALLFIVVVVAFAACKKTDDKQCSFLAPSIVLVNFTQEDMDTIIIRRFSNNNQFSQLLDTTFFPSTSITKTPVGQDSVKITVPYERFNDAFASFNWEIAFPGTTSLTRFSDFQVINNDEEETGAECHTFVGNVKVYESLPYTRQYVFPTWVGNQYRIYITK